MQNGAETWHEFYNPTVHFQRNYDHSSCCANGLSPSLHLFADIVGIRPGSPGFKQVIFSPGYEQVERVKATVPTVRGDIELEWSYDSTAGLAVNMKSDFPFELLFVAEEGMILAEWQLSSKITLIERDKLDT